MNEGIERTNQLFIAFAHQSYTRVKISSVTKLKGKQIGAQKIVQFFFLILLLRDQAAVAATAELSFVSPIFSRYLKVSREPCVVKFFRICSHKQHISLFF